jgi:hypothetical protein
MTRRLLRSVAALSLLVVGCADDLAVLERVNRAHALDAALAPATLDPLVAFWAKSEEVRKPLWAQGLKVEQTCGNENFVAIYAPAVDQLSFTFTDPSALTQVTQVLTINGVDAWRNPQKANRQKFLTDSVDAKAKSAPVIFPAATKDFPQLFPPDSDLTLSIGATSEVSRRKGTDEFSYETVTFQPRRVRVHTLSSKVVDEQSAWVERAAPVAARLHLLNGKTSSYDASLRAEKHPEVVAAVKRFDDLVEATKRELAALGDAPAKSWKAALTIEPCGSAPAEPPPAPAPKSTPAPSKKAAPKVNDSPFE